ncbi:hypothetical protein [Bacillus thuringiensis]|uniref:hypothetical protein n=1 Tax=Bacillus thuringiensis TaxID=1428 RepID=UPI0032C4905B
MKQLAFNLSLVIFNRLKSVGKYRVPINAPPVFTNSLKIIINLKCHGIYLFPLADIQTATMGTSQTPYNPKGRKIAKHIELNKLVVGKIKTTNCKYP